MIKSFAKIGAQNVYKGIKVIETNYYYYRRIGIKELLPFVFGCLTDGGHFFAEIVKWRFRRRQKRNCNVVMYVYIGRRK